MVMGGVWLQNCYPSFRVLSLTRFREKLKTRKDCGKLASERIDKDLMSAGLEHELIHVGNCRANVKPVF